MKLRRSTWTARAAAGGPAPASATPGRNASSATEPRAVRFAPRGPLALEPRAFGLVLDAWDDDDGEPCAFQLVGDGKVALVEVVGPLMHHEEWWLDSYDAIKSRVAAALESEARCVLLSIDSPGGLVAGCFDTVSEIRALAAKAGKKLYAYADAQATSAGYALACAGERIFVPSTGVLGSIGVIDALLDATGADEQWGVKFTVITSGARKADGHPHTPTSAAAIAAAQANVDVLAGVFFEVVAERRPGLSVEKIRGLEAAMLIGQQAVDAGLADEIATLDQVIAKLSAEESAGAAATPPAAGAGAAARARGALALVRDTHSPAGMGPAAVKAGGAPAVRKLAMTMQEIRAGLKAVAEDENADEKERENARAALAALDAKAEGGDGDEGDKGDDKDKDGDKPAAESDKDKDEPAPADDKDKDEKSAIASLGSALAAMGRKVDGLVAAIAQRDKAEKTKADAAKREALFAARPDVPKAMREALASTDPKELEAILKATPVQAPGAVSAARAALGVVPTQPQGTDAPKPGDATATSNRSGHGDELDRAMGLSKPGDAIALKGNSLELGLMTPEQARAFLAAQRKAG